MSDEHKPDCAGWEDCRCFPTSAERRLAEALDLLREVQWIGFGWCPVCNGENDEGHGHYKTCRLAALLDAAPPSGSSGTVHVDNGEGFRREGEE